jgi:hypothetical protein
MWKKVMFLIIVVAGISVMISVSASGSITGPGDAAITGYNADGNDNIAFVLLGDTTPNQVIYFTDNEWNGSPIGSGGAFNSGEGFVTWTAPATSLVAGTVIEIADASTTPSASEGAATKTGSFNLSSSNEVLYMYLGTDESTPTAFLTAFANDDFGSGSISNTGLTEGTNAMRFDSVDADVDVAQYAGSRGTQSTAADYLAQIMDTNNWDHQDGSGDQSKDSTSPDVPFDITSFTKPTAITFAGMNASNGPSNNGVIALLGGFSALLFGGFWLRRRTTTH